MRTKALHLASRPASAESSRASDAADAAILCRGVTKSYGAHVALRDVTIAIRPNEFFTLLGPSGCGKTTLLRAIAGFVGLDAGEISVHGQAMGGLPPYRRPVNTVFQSYAVFPHMSVADNIGFGLEMDGWPRRRIAPRVEEMLALVRLEGLGGRRPAQLSGGQQQRVAIARALAKSPRVLLLDEPLSALDLKLRVGMQQELKRLQRETGITFVFVTHDQREALTMSDRLAVMDAGAILQIGTPEEIYERPAGRFVADFIGETNFLDAETLGAGRYRIEGGTVVVAEEAAQGAGPVTLAIRPERVRIDPDAALRGEVRHVVYEGTDIVVTLALPGGVTLRARVQNHAAPLARPVVGEVLGVALPPASVRVLRQ